MCLMLHLASDLLLQFVMAGSQMGKTDFLELVINPPITVVVVFLAVLMFLHQITGLFSVHRGCR